MATSKKVIIVTGASRGIGQAIVNYLLTDPNTYIVATARTATALSSLEAKAPDRVAVVTGDMAEPSAAQKVTETALSRWGRIDGLAVNHATLDPISRIEDTDVARWKQAFDVNVFSAVNLLKVALAHLRAAKGNIIFTSSGAAVKGTATWGSYSASKAVLNSLARTLAMEEPDVVTLAIRPGVVDTEMQETLRDQHFGKMSQVDVEKFKWMRERGEMLKPEQPGNVIGRLVMAKLAGRGWSGEFCNWNDEKLKEFQG